MTRVITVACRKEETEEFSSVAQSTTTAATSTKSSQPSRLVNLGAAATFAASSQQPSAAPQPKTETSDIDNLFGDFSSVPPPQPVQQQQQQPQTGRQCICVSIVLPVYSLKVLVMSCLLIFRLHS